jgi:hypothetical protein
MMQDILETIFSLYEAWIKDLPVSCRRGCSTCCTLNVSISWFEGWRIHRFIKANCMEEWLAWQLDRDVPVNRPQLSTNAFAGACLAGTSIDVLPMDHTSTCPFLEDNLCCIYEVRPFACIGFASQTPCSPGQPARVPPYYLAATTAIDQILEHLSQGYPWGNMISVLLALAETPAFRRVAEILANSERIQQHHNACLTAMPLPGFLIGRENQTQVFPLLEKIYNADIKGNKLEDILESKNQSGLGRR